MGILPLMKYYQLTFATLQRTFLSSFSRKKFTPEEDLAIVLYMHEKGDPSHPGLKIFQHMEEEGVCYGKSRVHHFL